jgi:hydroxyacylglutathione hydrolase
MSANLPLEDNFNDIIGKAMRGLVLTDAAVAERAGVEAAAVQSLREGAWNEAVARRVAPVLGLQADALAASGNKAWRPQPIDLAGFAQFNTPFEDYTVNSYLAWDAASGLAVAFDSGADCSAMLATIAEKKLTLALILITHTHSDHILELDRLREKTGAPAFVSDREPLDGAEAFSPGRTFEAGALRIETRLTWGHSKGGITYVVRGLARPVAVVGDAVFAGSMGGGMVSYEAALATNRAEIFTLPDDTVIAPGHGPLTTVAEERAHNPFFAA